MMMMMMKKRRGRGRDNLKRGTKEKKMEKRAVGVEEKKETVRDE